MNQPRRRVRERRDLELIERVRGIDRFFATTMEEHEFDSALEAVPFWRSTRVRTVTARTAARTVSRRYGDDGSSLFFIARPDAIYAINTRERMILDTDTLPAYVRFFVAQAGVGRGMRIVEDASEAKLIDDQWLSANDQTKKKNAAAAIRPIATGGEVVLATAIRNTDLVEVAIKVSAHGVVSALTTVVIAEQVPVVS